jgi:hypothetical protein
MIVSLCCFELHMIVLKAEQAARMQMRKDEEREAKERRLVILFFCLDQKIFVVLSAT